MKEEIIILRPKLEEANVQTNYLIKTVQKEQITVDQRKKVVEEEEQICLGNSRAAEELKNQCTYDLNMVMPILEEASKNLKTIQRSHIDFIKQIKNPLPAIKKLFQGLCILYQIQNVPQIKDPDNQYKKLSDWTTPT